MLRFLALNLSAISITNAPTTSNPLPPCLKVAQEQNARIIHFSPYEEYVQSYEQLDLSTAYSVLKYLEKQGFNTNRFLLADIIKDTEIGYHFKHNSIFDSYIPFGSKQEYFCILALIQMHYLANEFPDEEIIYTIALTHTQLSSLQELFATTNINTLMPGNLRLELRSLEQDEQASPLATYTNPNTKAHIIPQKLFSAWIEHHIQQAIAAFDAPISFKLANAKLKAPVASLTLASMKEYPEIEQILKRSVLTKMRNTVSAAIGALRSRSPSPSPRQRQTSSPIPSTSQSFSPTPGRRAKTNGSEHSSQESNTPIASSSAASDTSLLSMSIHPFLAVINKKPLAEADKALAQEEASPTNSLPMASVIISPKATTTETASKLSSVQISEV